MNKDFRETLDARLSGMRWGEREKANVLRLVRREEVQEVKHVKRGSAMLAFAMATLLFVMGTAFAVSIKPTPTPTPTAAPQSDRPGNAVPALTAEGELFTAIITAGVYDEKNVQLTLDLSLKEGTPYTALRSYLPAQDAAPGELSYAIQFYLTVEQQEYPFARQSCQFYAQDTQIEGTHLTQQYIATPPFLNDMALVEADIRFYDPSGMLVEQCEAGVYLQQTTPEMFDAQPTPQPSAIPVMEAQHLTTIEPMMEMSPTPQPTLQPTALAATSIPLAGGELWPSYLGMDMDQMEVVAETEEYIIKAGPTGPMGDHLQLTVQIDAKQPEDVYLGLVEGTRCFDNAASEEVRELRYAKITAVTIPALDYEGKASDLYKWFQCGSATPIGGERVAVCLVPEDIGYALRYQHVQMCVQFYNAQQELLDEMLIPFSFEEDTAPEETTYEIDLSTSTVNLYLDHSSYDGAYGTMWLRLVPKYPESQGIASVNYDSFDIAEGKMPLNVGLKAFVTPKTQMLKTWDLIACRALPEEDGVEMVLQALEYPETFDQEQLNVEITLDVWTDELNLIDCHSLSFSIRRDPEE